MAYQGSINKALERLIADRMEEVRLGLVWKADEMAEAMGVSRSDYFAMKRGAKKIEAVHVLRLIIQAQITPSMFYRPIILKMDNVD